MSEMKNSNKTLYMPPEKYRITSVYIPFVKQHVTQEALLEEMENFIGKVNDIIFSAHNKLDEDRWCSAYIYFHPEAQQAMYVGGEIKDNWRDNGYYWHTDCELQDSLYLYENSKPIEQILRYNQDAIQDIVEEQQDIIYKTNERLKGCQGVLYCLISGLYCQRTQGDAIDELLSDLYPKEGSLHEEGLEASIPQKVEEKSKWDTWPTTRQGDECERQIEELKEEIKTLKEEMTTMKEEMKTMKEEIKKSKRPKTIAQLRNASSYKKDINIK